MAGSEQLTDLYWLGRAYGRRAKASVIGNRPIPAASLRNCLILGSGRSGTSMLAGGLRRLGYFMGDNLIAPRAGNPKGFFEDHEVNRINDALIHRAMPSTVPEPGWITAVPIGTEFNPRRSLARRVAAQTERRPFCLKDPRFCYTLPAWLPHLDEVTFVCVFREPARTANSILNECRAEPYLARVDMDFERAVRLWTLMYRHVLEHHCRGGNWVFVHYDQVLNGSAASRISTAIGAAFDADFAAPALRRSPPTGLIGAETERLYRHLCGLADHEVVPTVAAG